MDMHDDDELEGGVLPLGGGSLLDDEDPEVGLVPDDEEDEDPLLNGFSAVEEDETGF